MNEAVNGAVNDSRNSFDLVLHVGMPRSGPPLRRALQQLRPQLHSHGVAVLGTAELKRLAHLKGWDSDGQAQRGQAAAFGRDLAAAVRSASRHAAGVLGRRSVQVVISSDRLLGGAALGRDDADGLRPYAERATAHVIESLSAQRVGVVLYTHRQDRLMELAYLRRVQAGERHSFAEQFPYRFEPVLDYANLVERLRGVAHVADVVVRPVELLDAGTHSFVNDFLSTVGLRDTLDLYALPTDLSPHPDVYSGRAAQLAVAMRPLLETAAETRLVNDYLAKNYLAGERYTTDLLEKDDRRRILDAYASRNEELFRTHMPDLPADSYADDTATFHLANFARSAAPPPEPGAAARLGAAAAARAVAARDTLSRRARPLAGRVRRRLRSLLR